MNAADTASPGAAGDLPASIGTPATRALHGAGITTLDALSTRTRAELLALHGFGPKAARILAEALEERGLSFAGE
nr:helix-hairpin-helix domain-containing protein [Nocardia cyriacigeorgica]